MENKEKPFLIKKVKEETKQMDLKEILQNHKKWASGNGGARADLRGANLCDADLYDADLRVADLYDANLRNANLCDADLCGADLRGANLRDADLCDANLRDADLCGANLRDADLRDADLRDAKLCGANLRDVKNMIKIIGVEAGNYYWKRCESDLSCNDFKFKIGLNNLRDGEVFASDERVLCSFPGFHFASRSWCSVHYGERPLEVKIRIPEGAQINEPWATDGKASANMIEVIEVWRDGVNVTEEFRK